jgi:spermidine synthase
MCEIDRRVCDVSKEFFPKSMAVGFSDPRMTLVRGPALSARLFSRRRARPHPSPCPRLPAQLYMDAAAYMKAHANEFDVIIVDSSDPVGPAETLYTSDFYRDMHLALRDGGIVCTQGECQWLHRALIEKVMRDAGALYPVVDYAYSGVPTYPNGQIGYILGCKAARGGKALRTPARPVPASMRGTLRYYSEAVHSAAFALPAFAVAALGSARAPQDAAAAATADGAARAAPSAERRVGVWGVAAAAAAAALVVGELVRAALKARK